MTPQHAIATASTKSSCSPLRHALTDTLTHISDFTRTPNFRTNSPAFCRNSQVCHALGLTTSVRLFATVAAGCTAFADVTVDFPHCLVQFITPAGPHFANLRRDETRLHVMYQRALYNLLMLRSSKNRSERRKSRVSNISSLSSEPNEPKVA